jgi:hypothetical protein
MSEKPTDGLDREQEPESGGGIVEGACILVPEGGYELRYVDYDTATFFGNPKVVVHFAIANPAEYAGLPVDRFYNAKKLTGPAGRYGNYVASPRGALIREFSRIIDPPGRSDRISFAKFRNKRIIGDIETVKIDYKRERLQKGDYYSRVKELVSALPADDW